MRATKDLYSNYLHQLEVSHQKEPESHGRCSLFPTLRRASKGGRTGKPPGTPENYRETPSLNIPYVHTFRLRGSANFADVQGRHNLSGVRDKLEYALPNRLTKNLDVGLEGKEQQLGLRDYDDALGRRRIRCLSRSLNVMSNSRKIESRPNMA